jgi:PAS domain S-box-containing protein
MTDGRKTKTEILAELQQLRQRMADLEAAASGTPDGAPAIDVLTKYQLLAAVARDVILFVRARDGRILEANHAAEETYGYSRAELLGLTIHDLRAPSTQSSIAAQMNQADLQGVTFETRHRRRDGHEFPVEVNSGGITLGSERILLQHRARHHRTQAGRIHKATLEALRQSEDAFQVLLQRAGGLSLTRVDGAFFEVNERFTELFESAGRTIGHTAPGTGCIPSPEERAELKAKGARSCAIMATLRAARACCARRCSRS